MAKEFSDLFELIIFCAAVPTDTSSNVGLVAGTAAGTVVVVVLIVAVAVVLLCRKRSEFVSQPSGYEILQELPPCTCHFCVLIIVCLFNTCPSVRLCVCLSVYTILYVKSMSYNVIIL